MIAKIACLCLAVLCLLGAVCMIDRTAAEIVFFCLAAISFLVAVCMAWGMYKKKKTIGFVTPVHMLFVAVIAAGILLYTPAYCYYLQDQITCCNVVQAFRAPVLAIYSTVRLFMCDGDFSVVTEGGITDGIMRSLYMGFLSLLQLAAPALTAVSVLAVLSNLSSWLQYRMSRNKNICVFSELNEGSLILAKEMKENHSESAFAFAGIHPEKTPEELQKAARELGAILFRKEVTELPLQKHSKDKSIWFFAIAQDEQTNVKHGLHLVEQYGDWERANLYVFANSMESEALFSTLHNKKIIVRRISLVRSVINRMLYDEGKKLFDNAILQPDGKKIITAVVVGMKKYGTVMAKTLPWFSQMDGYHLHLHLFDARRDAEDKFAMDCPELLMKNYNGVHTKEGESCDTIDFYSGIQPDTKTFADHIAKLKDVTYVLVDLGRDDRNIETAMTLRMLFERSGAKPEIQVVLSSSEKKKALKNLKNFKDQAFDLDFIGDPESSYTESVVLDSEVEADARDRHLRGGYPEEIFWAQEYNYRSSIALSIAVKMRRECGITFVQKPEKDMTEEEKEKKRTFEALEHRRWNSYVRSEGYIYNKERNDLGKMHNLLVTFDALTDSQKKIDSDLGAD